MDVSNA
jgi:hypothetical protein